MLDKVKLGKYSIDDHVSADAQDLISQMLQIDPKKRISIPKIVQHPWYQHQMSKSTSIGNKILPEYCTVESAELLDLDPEIGFNNGE